MSSGKCCCKIMPVPPNIKKKRNKTTPPYNTRPAKRFVLVVFLEALLVDNSGSALVVLLLLDPHRREGRQGRQDRSSDPHGVLPLRGCNNLDLHAVGRKVRHLLRQTVGKSLVHRGSSRQHNVGVQVFTHVNVALHDRVVHSLVDAVGLKSDELGLEEGLRATETLRSHSDHLTVGKLVVLLQGGGGGGERHLLVEVL